MPDVVPIRFDDPADLDRWQRYVHGRADSHCADLGEWRRLFAELYGFAHRTWVAVEGERTVGALSLYHIRSPFLGKMLVSCPFFGYGGMYWESDAAREALLERAGDAARELKVDYVEVRSGRELPAPFRANTDFAEYNLELEATPDETWSRRLSSNVRRNVRKARSHDLEFRLTADPAPCYDLLRRTLRAHGTPFHGRRFFELLGKHLGDRVRYSEVWGRGRLVAGGVVIRFKDTIITPYIGSLADSRPARANYLQYWALIEHGARAGYRRFEMGRSPRGSTHARFKMKWGCVEAPVFYNYLVVNSRKRYRSVSRPSAVQRLATRVWRRLPLALTSAVGPRLFRHVP